MSIYDPVITLLDKALEDLKETVSAAAVIANRDEALDPFSLNQLIKANARAEAALVIKHLIKTSKEEHLPVMVQTVEREAKKALRGSANPHFSVVGLYNEVVATLKTIVESQKVSNL